MQNARGNIIGILETYEGGWKGCLVFLVDYTVAVLCRSTIITLIVKYELFNKPDPLDKQCKLDFQAHG
jgi:hypothetical protein